MLASLSGSVTVTLQCADNAHIKTSSSLNVSSTSNGNWSGETPRCQCDEGYHKVNVSGTQICEGEQIAAAIISLYILCVCVCFMIIILTLR